MGMGMGTGMGMRMGWVRCLGDGRGWRVWRRFGWDRGRKRGSVGVWVAGEYGKGLEMGVGSG